MNKNTQRFCGILFVLSTILILFGLAACNEDSGLECGEGTIFDETTNTCIADGSSDDPDFNGVIGSATLGDFTLTNLSYPDRLVPGVEQTHSVTITNKATKKSKLTMIRVSMAEGDQSAVDAYLEKAAGVGTVCANAACSSSNVLTACTLTQDATGAITNERGSCSSGYYCHPVSKLCFMKLIPVAALPVEELEAGASITKNYKISLPGDWTSITPKWLIYTIGEETLSYNAKGEIISPANSSLPAAEDSIVRAKGVLLAGPSEVFIPKEPDLTIVDLKVDNSSFELDSSSTGSQPAFIVNARFMAVGRDQTEAPELSFRLKLPGMVQYGCSWNGNSSYSYRKDRQIGIIVDCPTCDRRQQDMRCDGRECEIRVRPYEAECRKTNTCSETNPSVVWKSGQIVDGTFRIYITDTFRKLLTATLDRKDLNPELTNFNELPGKLTVRIRNKENFLGYPVEKSLDVMFLPPPAAAVAKDTDPVEPADSGVEENDKFASDYPSGTYPEADELTPTLYDMFGSEWAGASYQVKNISSKERLHQAIVKQALLADNYFRLHLFEGSIDLLKLGADVDLSTRRALSDNKATGEVVVPSIMSASDLIGKLLGFSGDKQLMDTLVSFDFDPRSDCKEDDDIESCMIWGGQEDPAAFGDITFNTGIELPDSEQAVSYEASKEKTICKGPLCFTAAMSVSFTVGIRGTLGFVRDSRNAPEYSTGIEATLGVFASADGSASGELSIILASIAIVGDVNFVDARFTPTLRLGIVQQLESNLSKPCWWTNTGRITFEGPASVEALSGEVRIEAYIGREIDLGFFTINLRQKVFEFTLVDWDPVWSKSWMLWSESKDFCGGSGLCADAPNPSIVWKTPIGCKTPTGADGYCNAAIPYDKNGSPLNPWIMPSSTYHGNYVGRFYLSASSCGTLTVNGSVDRWGNSDFRDSCLTGDAFNMVFGPLRWDYGVAYDFSRDWNKLEIYPADSSVCRWEVKQPDGSTRFEGGTVYCGPYTTATDPRRREESMRIGPYSGNFNNTLFKFCPRNTTWEDVRWIDLFLKTDDAGTNTGLTVKFDPAEGAESAIYSDEKWWSLRMEDGILQPTWRLMEGDGRFGFKRAYAGGSLNSGPWYGQPRSPFNWTDAAKAKWIWWESTGNSYAGYAFFRRPFLAAKESYTASIRCDNACEVYLDGGKIASNDNWGVPTVFTVTTEPMRMHMLAIKASNQEDGGAQGLNFMMK